ncbi:MAG: hypothetical protein HUU47_11270 [Bacteroidetes bacterium]|nr:hypothetical protein [Bacteroidota bacterium]
MLCIYSFSALAQTPFETHYGSSNMSGDGISSEFVSCASVDPNNYTYAAVHAIKDLNATPPTFSIRGVRIKNDGTMLIANFDYIKESTGDYDLFPLKIVPVNNNSEYMIIGYITHINTPDSPNPFVIRADANLDAFEFKVFTDHKGFFTDVDQLTNGDYIFCGSHTNSLQIGANYRLGWMLRTNSSYTKIWMRFTHSYEHPTSVVRKDFDIVHDMMLIDDDTAIVCGNVCEQIDCDRFTGLDTSSPVAFIAKVDLSNGSFGWYNSKIANSTASRLAMSCDNTKIIMSVNGENVGSSSSLSFWDRAGNYILGKLFEGTSFNSKYKKSGISYTVSINLHSQISIQNLYNTSNNKLFISGKFYKTVINDSFNSAINIDTVEIPFSVNYDINSSSFDSMNVFKSSQKFTFGPNFLSYRPWKSCGSYFYPSIYFASNTIPVNTDCENTEFVTVTLDVASDASTNQIGYDKVWIFSNDTNPCGFVKVHTIYQDLELKNNLNIENHLMVHDPLIFDFINYLNLSPNSFPHNCEQ